ncbi:hypothetical protein NC653_014576 [Populus alba x Populus x berolinensis]|uniref:Uncharacterized protein n=1 Tax=Populus alba x Populus x berolinensis TaxID=444605 RepID=A0AAD6W3Y6_9ROSI|nr:hypothetical protein NC653_014576 [Populus alba x Populus x berolinensis]
MRLWNEATLRRRGGTGTRMFLVWNVQRVIGGPVYGLIHDEIWAWMWNYVDFSEDEVRLNQWVQFPKDRSNFQRATITDAYRHIRSRGTWDKREIWNKHEGNSNDLSNTWRKQGPRFSTSQFSQYENLKTNTRKGIWAKARCKDCHLFKNDTEINDDTSKGNHGHNTAIRDYAGTANQTHFCVHIKQNVCCGNSCEEMSGKTT